MGQFHKGVSHRHGDTQLLPALPDESLGLCLFRLYLTTRKLPKAAAGFAFRTLADQEIILIPNQDSLFKKEWLKRFYKKIYGKIF